MRAYKKKQFAVLKSKAEHNRLLFLEMIFLGSMVLCLGLSTQIKSEGLLGWWGFLYPKFCMMETVEDSEFIIGEATENQIEAGFYTKHDVKISFWLAKVFDW